GWAAGSAPRAGLGHVAVAGRRAAHGARRLEGIGGTGVARAVAGLGDVADARGRPTDGAGSARGVDGAGRADPRAGRGRGTDTRRSGTDGTGVARVVHACRRAHGAVARVGRARIAVVRTRRAGRPDGVGGTARARPRAGLGAVALVDGRATDGARRPEGIGRARGAGAGT